MEKINNLKNKSGDEILEHYQNIAIRSKIIREIWNKTKNYDIAIKIYNILKHKLNKLN